ncbi:MAG TPA: hypothetical protein VNG71_04415 [Pyrinomonadaceae bacterium]|nr:hypothetical protein [Pyrinomonadaceae bacterium]
MPNPNIALAEVARRAFEQVKVTHNERDSLNWARQIAKGHEGHDFTDDEIKSGVCGCSECKAGPV